MTYEYMTGMGTSIANLLDLNRGGTESEAYKQCKAAGGRIGVDISVPEGCIPSGTWSATGRSMPEHGYCCPGQQQRIPGITSIISGITQTRDTCEQQTCPPYRRRETLNISHVGVDGPRFTRMRREALESRGCIKLCTPRNQPITGSSIEYYCCPDFALEEPVSLPPIPGGEAGPGTPPPPPPSPVPTPPEPVMTLGPEARSWLERMPPWQLILGTGLIVGGIVWFVKTQ